MSENECFINERLQKLQNANFVKVYEILEDDERYYIVMEYLENGTLYDNYCDADDEPLSEDYCRPIIFQVAQALDQLHQRMIIHRDIKLTNVLIDNDSISIKLADFGSAVQIETACGTVKTKAGTPGYYAPEILKGEEYGTQADIYSLGAMMYALLTFKLPFLSDNDLASYKRGLTGYSKLDLTADPKLSNLSDKAKNLLSLMLEKDPSKRLSAR